MHATQESDKNMNDLSKSFIAFAKKLYRICSYMIKLIFCIFFSLIFGMVVGIVAISELDWQVVFYLVICTVLLVGIWIVFFWNNKKLRILYVLLFLIFLLASKHLPSVRYIYEFDHCVDTGDCSYVGNLKN